MTLDLGLRATYRYAVIDADTTVANRQRGGAGAGHPRVRALAERATVTAVGGVL